MNVFAKFYFWLENKLEKQSQSDEEKIIKWLEFVDNPENTFVGIIGGVNLKILRRIAEAQSISIERALTNALDKSTVEPQDYQLYRKALINARHEP